MLPRLAILLGVVLAGCDRPAPPVTTTRDAPRPVVTTQPATPFAAASSAGPAPTTRPGRARPVAGIWFVPSVFALPNERYLRLIVGIWSDGEVVWSGNRETGDKPYRRARIDKARIERLFNDFDRARMFVERERGLPMPDAAFTIMAAQSGSRRQWLGSWQETTSGRVWSDARRLIEQVVPATGEPTEEFDQGIFRLAG